MKSRNPRHASAQWTFLFWGFVHGLVLAPERLPGPGSVFARLPRSVRVLRTFLIYLLLQVVFRAADMGAAWVYMKTMFLGVAAGEGNAAAGAALAARVYQPVYLVVTVIGAAIIWGAPGDYMERVKASGVLTLMTFALFVTAIVAMFSQAENPFLYFQF